MDVPESGAAGSGAPDLTEGFPVPTPDRWRRLVAAVLRKSGVAEERLADHPEAVLATRTYDGFDIAPLATSEPPAADPGYPGMAPFTRGHRPGGAVAGGWDIRARYSDADPGTLRRRVHTDLMNGVSSLWIAVGDGRLPADRLGTALTDVHLDLAPVVLEPGAAFAEAADALLSAHADAEVPDGRIISHLGIDPLTTAARAGSRPDVMDAVRFAVDRARDRPGLGLTVADATLVHNAGGSDGQELGYAIAAGAALLRALVAAGLDIADAAGRIEFRLAVSTDQFAGIAKLRAARAMWNRVLEVSGVPADRRPMKVHAVTSEAMLTRRDPHVNMLRTTVACFAAGVGGADSVTVLPYDAAVGLSDDFARRIARNTQALLIEESHLARVIDPAGGSFHVEALTRDLYLAGWAFLQEIEASGGAAEVIEDGWLRERVDDVWERRRRDLAHRRAPLTGVSEFPNLAERPLAREPLPERDSWFPVRRYAGDFEELRDRSDAAADRPTAFLATLGPVAAHTARATFAANLLAAGGVDAHRPGPLEDAEAVARAFTASGLRVAVLCSSEKVYAEHVEAAVEALRNAGAERVLLAGAPRALDADAFLHQGCDAVALLTELVDLLVPNTQGASA
ncbi:methylmalonyl-CoA mutase family protein [Nocardiopsis lambiniae]|uniref:methylmalonyl-CoA mutase n=1 Tax=Nocardiopsis lambiniae TaxID=3075539 RepID=A0ABU2M6K6_9ACTN|nr:methylmalonyl-CoA mutase family protein [Nocardiopsis sp. DSM 44743]MDT0328152.1 methylmalonyl-CoA mutase family protein [Nocardiopsis sp. DSM 44743]